MSNFIRGLKSFSLTYYRQTIYNGIIESIDKIFTGNPEEIEKMTIPIWFAMKVCAAKLILNNIQIEQIASKFKSRNILGFYQRGEATYREVKRTGIDTVETPETFKQSIKQMLSIFKITDYITIYDYFDETN